MQIKESVIIGGKELTIETGRLAKQADGSVIVRYGDTMVLVTAVASDSMIEADFVPLTVEYAEKMYAAGRIPGSYFRREGRPATHEILTCRIIDRPIRPLFPKKWRHETQVVAMVLSTDRENPADVLALTGASTALLISDIPWEGPIVGVRVGRVDGQFLANPTEAQQKISDINLVVACSFDAVVMVEGGGRFIQEADVVDALAFAQEQARPVLELQEKIRAAVGKAKRPVIEATMDEALVNRVSDLALEKLKAAVATPGKLARNTAIHEVADWVLEQLGQEYAERQSEVHHAFEEVHRRYLRGTIINQGVRIDGRALNQIRTITCDVGLLPRVHGSALFTRGETQALSITTLATHTSDQRIESVMGDYDKSFLLHYNFPPFSTGEAKRMGSPGRREIGHGNLAERALSAVLPEPKDFPYALRIVSEVLESNGSSSMATVCGGTLSLMDAGVPIQAPVAGIAMGLIKEGDSFAILSDILGDEDHLGDMDFKVAGTREGITAVQMDIKIKGLPREVMAKALEQAREGRLFILNRMAETLAVSRVSLSPNAPRIITIRIKPDRIRDIIGPGGKTIRAIQDESGAEIEVSDDGTVLVASADEVSARKAMDLIQGLTAEAEMGAIYRGKVRRIAEFGAFVEILPGVDGLCHISELDAGRVKRVEDICSEGEEMVVKVINIDRDGKIRLSRKEALNASPDQLRSMV